MTGEWPSGDIDHINGQRADNRFSNLRSITHAQNGQHRKGPQANNKSGFLGVYKKRNKWRAEIMVDGIKYALGLHADPHLAKAAHDVAKRTLHTFNN
jgi:hypothetical protein